ncbi:MAG TPA: enolase C-terminal domain-like protein [Candidatus Dormibacteraeota bacterium]|nr:enolase C-terminal domain-like protein [Candidatus Dormibacteraeota bacterium]
MSTHTIPPADRTGAAIGDASIESIGIEVVRRRYTVPFGISSGSTAELTSLLVTLSGAGETGVGETTPMTAYSGETLAGLREVIEDHLAPAVRGRQVFDLAGLHLAMDGAIRGRPLAKAALDIALLDLQGRLLGVPVTALLGGRVRERVDIAWVVGLDDVGATVREAAAMAERGFRHIKVKGGIDPRRDLELVTELVRALPAGVEVGLDANEGYDRAAALPALRRMEAAGLALVEQPLPAWDVRGMAELTAALDLLVAADEGLYTLQDAATLARERACDVFNIKVLKVGGLHRARQIAALAEAEGIAVKVGSMPELGMATLAAAHLAAATPGASIAADLVGPLMVESDILASPRLDLERCPGSVEVPRGPGLGATLLDAGSGGR